MGNYDHLLSPIKIGNQYLKNRLVSSTSMPHYLQGPERFPADSMITHVANRAKGGAGVVTCTGFDDPAKVPPMEDIVHFPIIDQYNTRSQNYISQMVDAIHFYEAKACIAIMPDQLMGRDVVESEVPAFMLPPGSKPMKNKMVTEEELIGLANAYAEQATLFQKCGFDMVSIHFAYQGPLGAKFLSKQLNTRTDQYGGSAENRARFPLMVYKKIREACGENMLIETLISGEDPDPINGTSIEDVIKYAKYWEDYVDILQLRAPGLDPNHPTSYCLEETPWLKYAEAVKESGVNIAVESIGGFTDLRTCEAALASGKVDLISGARCWISNPNFGLLAQNDCADDVVPCLRCNKCHVNTIHGPYLSVCSVNPEIGMEHRLSKLITPPQKEEKIAIVGGGPSGMEAALIAAKRGQKVTLYEKSPNLGGQIIPGSIPAFKWTLKNYKDFMVKKVTTHPNITVLLNTEATPSLIKAQNYDEVLVAIGAEPMKPNIPGINDSNALTGIDALLHPEKVTGNVVVIGGGEIGVETGMYLAQKGHKVTVLEMRDKLAADSTPIHYYTMFKEAWEHTEGFSGITNAKVSAISNKEVSYMDKNDTLISIPADTVILSVGMKAKTDEAYSFHGSAKIMKPIGDCFKVGSVQSATKTAYAAASLIG